MKKRDFWWMFGGALAYSFAFTGAVLFTRNKIKEVEKPKEVYPIRGVLHVQYQGNYMSLEGYLNYLPEKEREKEKTRLLGLINNK